MNKKYSKKNCLKAKKDFLRDAKKELRLEKQLYNRSFQY